MKNKVDKTSRLLNEIWNSKDQVVYVLIILSCLQRYVLTPQVSHTIPYFRVKNDHLLHVSRVSSFALEII